MINIYLNISNTQHVTNIINNKFYIFLQVVDFNLETFLVYLMISLNKFPPPIQNKNLQHFIKQYANIFVKYFKITENSPAGNLSFSSLLKKSASWFN